MRATIQNNSALTVARQGKLFYNSAAILFRPHDKQACVYGEIFRMCHCEFSSKQQGLEGCQWCLVSRLNFHACHLCSEQRKARKKFAIQLSVWKWLTLGGLWRSEEAGEVIFLILSAGRLKRQMNDTAQHPNQPPLLIFHTDGSCLSQHSSIKEVKMHGRETGKEGGGDYREKCQDVAWPQVFIKYTNVQSAQQTTEFAVTHFPVSVLLWISAENPYYILRPVCSVI